MSHRLFTSSLQSHLALFDYGPGIYREHIVWRYFHWRGSYYIDEFTYVIYRVLVADNIPRFDLGSLIIDIYLNGKYVEQQRRTYLPFALAIAIEDPHSPHICFQNQGYVPSELN